MVGAVVARGERIVGEGFHRVAGEPHAEPIALAAAGRQARGATLYVSLEPCTHHGRTPPCVEAVIAAGVRRVVVCHRDPDPRMAGRGLAALRTAGIAVDAGTLAREAVRLNFAYLVSVTLGRPAITLKWAQSLDGRIAAGSGRSQWISGPPARRWALDLRERHDAVLVGVGTILADDPRLDRRLGRAPGPGLRVVLDRRLRTPATARLFTVEGPVVMYTRNPQRARRAALERVGAEVVVLPEVSPERVVEDLERRGVRSLLVEGGGEVLGAFAAAGLYDRVQVVTAPLLLGGAVGALREPLTASPDAAPRLEEVALRRLGTDWILTGYRDGCLPALYKSVGA